jgi:hypothetical protein
LSTRVDILSLRGHVAASERKNSIKIDLIEVEPRIVPQLACVDDATRAIEVRTARRITASHRAATRRTVMKMDFMDGIART